MNVHARVYICIWGGLKVDEVFSIAPHLLIDAEESCSIWTSWVVSLVSLNQGSPGTCRSEEAESALEQLRLSWEGYIHWVYWYRGITRGETQMGREE